MRISEYKGLSFWDLGVEGGELRDLFGFRISGTHLWAPFGRLGKPRAAVSGQKRKPDGS